MKKIDDSFFTEKTSKKTINDCLRQDEKILWQGCPKKRAYVCNKLLIFTPLALLWAVIDITAIVMLAVNNHFMWILIPFFAIHLAPFWIWIYSVVKTSGELRGTMYVITNLRIIVFKNNYGYIETTMRISDLNDISLQRKGFDKLLRVGDIYIKGKTSNFVLFDIPDYNLVFSKLNEICTEKKATEEFYKDKKVCLHCDSYFDKDKTNCPNCGAPADK